MKRPLIAVALLAGLSLLAPTAIPASHNGDVHSDNISLLANFDDNGTYRQGSDLAFWGNTAVLGNYDNPGGFRLLDISDPASPAILGQFKCTGPQNDVSIWRNLVFVSVDSPRSDPDKCTSNAASQAQVLSGTAWEGIRIVSIANPAVPRQIASVYTDCGSHTHTLLPDLANRRLLIYVLSYPLSGQGARCNATTHRKISVIEVPLSKPRAARVISTPSVAPAIGCHDVTVLPQRKLAAAACISESQLWDISDPVHPAVLSHIQNPAINIHHSTAFSWDGNTAVIGDELGGADAAAGCSDGIDELPIGALWFYDVSNPSAPVLKGTFRIPQQVVSIFCTAHNFNVVPLQSGKDILTSAWYNGGTTVVDFTNPADPQQIGYYIANSPTQNRNVPVQSAAWSSYWYNGLIYVNNFDEDVNSLTERSRGFDVLSITDPDLTGAVKLGHLNPQTQEPLKK